MKGLLFFLDKPIDDSLLQSMEKEPSVGKYWFKLGMSIIFLLACVLIGGIAMVRYDLQGAPETHAVNVSKKTSEQIIVLPYPHQSFSNVSNWAIDAVTSAYSFDFTDFDKQVQEAGYYFTSDGFQSYKDALTINGVRQSVIDKKLQVSIVPMQDPVFVNMGSFGGTEFWRIRIPVLISAFGGKEPQTQKMQVEILVLRVPSYQNHKGLAIAQFNMTPV